MKDNKTQTGKQTERKYRRDEFMRVDVSDGIDIRWGTTRASEEEEERKRARRRREESELVLTSVVRYVVMDSRSEICCRAVHLKSDGLVSMDQYRMSLVQAFVSVGIRDRYSPGLSMSSCRQ